MKKLLLLMVSAALLLSLPALSDMFHDRTDPTASGGITGSIVDEGLKLTEAVAGEQGCRGRGLVAEISRLSLNGISPSFSFLRPHGADSRLKDVLSTSNGDLASFEHTANTAAAAAVGAAKPKGKVKM